MLEQAEKRKAREEKYRNYVPKPVIFSCVDEGISLA